MTAMTAPIQTHGVTETREQSPPTAQPRNMTDLLFSAVENKMPVEQLKEVFAMYERASDRVAQQAFAAATAAFQRECPPIKKNSTASIVTKSGSSFKYTFAELDDIARTVNPILARNGLSYTWDATVKGGDLTCVCTVRHVDGFSQTSSITVPTDTASAMSSQQKVGAALTFARRLSLCSALGLTATDDDIDGGDKGDTSTVSDEQIANITKMMENAATANKRELPEFIASFLTYMGVADVKQIRAAEYQKAVDALRQKKEKKVVA